MSLQQITHKLLKEYKNKRIQNDRILEEKKQIIYDKIPRIKEIDTELNRTGLNLATCTLKSSNKIDIETAINQIQQKNILLTQEKLNLLEQYNFPKDFLEIKYTCDKCKDTGFIENNKCSCFNQKLIDQLYSQSNLKNILDVENFDNFDFSLYPSTKTDNNPLSSRVNIQHIFKECMDFTNNFNLSSKDLLMIGEPGLGKTFLCNCIAKDLLDRGITVLYQTAPDLFSVLEKFKFTPVNDPLYHTLNDKVDFIFSCDLLVIDDLGTETVSPIINTAFFNVINSRMLNKKRIIISTNLSLDDIFENYSQRIISRIMGNYKILKFFGDDIRVKLRRMG